MADISQVKLPDGTTYNLKDSYVRTNYRALSNNDFDTINVTELNAGDLVVTGAARFLNTINGSISGNAVTATKATQDESGNNIKATYAASFSISDHTITLKNKNGVSLGTVTVPDNNDNTWRKVQVNGTDILGTATNTNPLNLKAGTNISLSNSSGTVTIAATDTWRPVQDNLTSTSTSDSLSANQGKILNDTKLEKTTYEWNKEVSFGSSGYLKIGSFAMYDSNVTIEINSTASTTYHGTLVIATQNVTSSSIGSVHVVKVYDDPTGVIAESLRIVWTNGSRNYDIYFVTYNWSKNLIHIQALGLYGYSDICTTQTGTPPTTTIGLEPINVLASKSAVSGGTDVSMVTTGEKATWNAKASSDTKNTAGSTDTSSKIYLIGATSQAANPQTYSQDTAYVGTDGCLYSGGSKVLTAHQDISGKVNKSGDTMSGALTVEASNSYSSYNEGIRINAGARTYATLLMGGTNGTTSGTNDGAFWIGVYNTGTTARRLMIAHNGSTNTGTYFYASSSSDISPSLRVGSNLQVANVISANVSNSGTAGGISLYSTDPTSYGVAMRSTSNGGKHGYVQGDWGTYFYMAGATNRGWVFCNAGAGNRASISTEGNMVLNGSLTLGGNTTNTSGVRQVYNETTKSLDFVFVA